MFGIVALGYGLVFVEFLQLHNVIDVIKHHAVAFQAVAARTPRFLVVAFERLGRVIVNHKPNVGLVNAHSEGNCGADYVHFFVQKSVLVAHARRRVQARVVGRGLDVVHVQELRHFFHRFAAQTIHNPRFALVVLNVFNQLFIDISRFWAHFIVQIFAIER